MLGLGPPRLERPSHRRPEEWLPADAVIEGSHDRGVETIEEVDGFMIAKWFGVVAIVAADVVRHRPVLLSPEDKRVHDRAGAGDRVLSRCSSNLRSEDDTPQLGTFPTRVYHSDR